MNSFPFQGDAEPRRIHPRERRFVPREDRLHACVFLAGWGGARGLPVGRGRGGSSAGAASRAPSVVLPRREACLNLRGCAYRVADRTKFFRDRVSGGVPCCGAGGCLILFPVMAAFFCRAARVDVPSCRLWRAAADGVRNLAAAVVLPWHMQWKGMPCIIFQIAAMMRVR